LDGDVEYATARLKEAIHCGMEWKVIFHKTVKSIARQKNKYGRVWEIDDASIFAQIDAFVQRCRDLIECASLRCNSCASPPPRKAQAPCPTSGAQR
jgi:dynein heavy chain